MQQSTDLYDLLCKLFSEKYVAFHSGSNQSRDVPLRNVIAVASNSKVVTDVELIVSIWYLDFSVTRILLGFSYIRAPSLTYIL